MANPGEQSLLNPSGDGNCNASSVASNLLRDEFLRLQRTEVDRGDPSLLGLVGDAAYSATYSGIQAPVVGVAQIADRCLGSNIEQRVSLIPAPSEEKFGTTRWHAQQIGGAAGIVLPFVVTRGTLKATGLTVATKGELAIASSGRLLSRANGAVIADGAVTGFAMDFFMTPVQRDEADFWKARRNNGLTGAATFGTLTAGSVILGRAARPFASELTGAKRLAADVSLGAASGAPAGVVNADVHSLLTKGTFATSSERAQGAYSMSMVGGVMSAAHRIPGQDGLSPLEYRQGQTAKSNLESMLAERARTAAAVSVADTVAGSVKLDRCNARGADSPEGQPKPGRAMASSDVVDGRVVEVQLPPALAPVLQKAINEGMKVSESTATATEVAQFIDFVRTEGAPVQKTLLKIAEETKDQRFLTVVQEACLPPQGVELPGREYKIEPEPGKPVTPDQLDRWKKFSDLVADPPSDSQGYSKFRSELFEWLDKNPDLHSWVKQFHKNSNHSKLAGPLDFFFESNELSRFMNVEKPVVRVAPAKPAAERAKEKPVEQPQERIIPMDILNMRTHAREFAEQAARAPYDADLSRNFQQLCYKSTGVSVGQFADVINQALRENGAHNVCSVGVERNELTLYRPKTEQTRVSIGVLDCNALPPCNGPVPGRDPVLTHRIGNELVKQLQYADTTVRQQQIFAQIVLKLRDAGIHPGEMAYELNYVIRENKAPWTVLNRENNKLELLSTSTKHSKFPIVTATFKTGK